MNLSALPDIVDKASVFHEHAMEGKHVDGPADPGSLTAENSINEQETVKKTSSHSINEVVIESFDAENTVWINQFQHKSLNNFIRSLDLMKQTLNVVLFRASEKLRESAVPEWQQLDII